MVVTIDSILPLQFVTSLGFPYTKLMVNKPYIRIIWSFFPPNLLAKAINLLTGAISSGSVGISWSGRVKCAPNDEDCTITIVCKLTN